MADYRISFQLYSARKFPPLDPQLETLARIGFDAVEPYRGAYGDDPAGFRKKLDEVGLACPTAHIGLAQLDSDRAGVIATAKILGLETVIVPAVPQEERSQGLAGWQGLAAKLGDHAAALEKSGLKLAWHNHAFEYVTLPDGSRPIDLILGAAGVLWEPDLGWIVRGGADIEGELAKFKGKVAAFHVKDLAPDGVTVDDGWTDIGGGTVDWKGIWPSIAASGSNLLVLEHDEPSDWKKFAENSYRFLAGMTGRK